MEEQRENIQTLIFFSKKLKEKVFNYSLLPISIIKERKLFIVVNKYMRGKKAIHRGQ